MGFFEFFEFAFLCLKYADLIFVQIKVWQEEKTEEWIAEGKQIAKEQMNAKTDEERRALLRRFVQHTSGTG